MRNYLEGTETQQQRAYSPAVITQGGRTVWLAGHTAPEGKYPASALITVSSFARPGIAIEIQGVAVIDADTQ